MATTQQKDKLTATQKDRFMATAKGKPVALKHLIDNNGDLKIINGLEPKKDQTFEEWIEIARDHYHAQFLQVKPFASHIPLIRERVRAWGYTTKNYATLNDYHYATVQLIKDTQVIMASVATLDRSITRTTQLFINATMVAIDNTMETVKEVAKTLSQLLIPNAKINASLDLHGVTIQVNLNRVALLIPCNKSMALVESGYFDNQSKLKKWIETRLVENRWNKAMKITATMPVVIESKNVITRDQEIATTPQRERKSTPIVNAEKPVTHPQPAQRGKRGKPADVSLVNAR